MAGERWCNHDEAAIGDDGVCECGFGPLHRRVEALMRLLVAEGHATQAARYQMDGLLREERVRPDTYCRSCSQYVPGS